MVEVFLLFAVWLGHSQRLFAVQRIRTTMDEIVLVSRHNIYFELFERELQVHLSPWKWNEHHALDGRRNGTLESRCLAMPGAWTALTEDKGRCRRSSIVLMGLQLARGLRTGTDSSFSFHSSSYGQVDGRVDISRTCKQHAILEYYW